MLETENGETIPAETVLLMQTRLRLLVCTLDNSRIDLKLYIS